MAAARDMDMDPYVAGDDVAGRLLLLYRDQGPAAVVAESARVCRMAHEATGSAPEPIPDAPAPAPAEPAGKAPLRRVRGADLLKPPME
jgi:hypothetical protein